MFHLPHELLHNVEVDRFVFVEDFEDVDELGQKEDLLVHGQVVLVAEPHKILHEFDVG